MLMRNVLRRNAIPRTAPRRRTRMVRAALAVVAATLLTPALPEPVLLPVAEIAQPALHGQKVVDETQLAKFIWWDLCFAKCKSNTLCCFIFQI